MREYFLLLLIPLVYSFELNTECGSPNNTYFDTSVMECAECGENKIPSDDGLECICGKKYAKTPETRDSRVYECVECTGNSVPSSDKYMCQACPDYNISNNDNEPYECICNGTYDVLIEKELNGEYKDTKECLSCSQNMYPGNWKHSCESCPYPMIREATSSYDCKCPETGGYIYSMNSCVKTSDISDAYGTEYTGNNVFNSIYFFVDSKAGVAQDTITSSATYAYFYYKAADDCGNRESVKGCQILANLCVLNLYYENNIQCKLYKKIAALKLKVSASIDSGWKEDMAWLFYERSAKAVLENENILMKVTFDPSDSSKINLMQFKLAEFSIDGTFLGFQDLSDQLILCPHSLEEAKKFREFGTNVKISCDLDLSWISSEKKTTFYELYFIDSDGTMHGVPVLITNYIESNENRPNTWDSSKTGWKLTRRFFIYDNLSGIEGGYSNYINNVSPTHVQWLRNAEIIFTLRSDEEQMIYLPMLNLTYRARTITYITNDDSTDKISFVSVYGMDTSRFWEIAKGIFIGMNVLCFICWIGRLYVWTKINPHKDSPTTYTRWIILTAIRMLITTWGFLMFWYLFGLTGYWFIFYKLQYHVYALIPPLTTYQENYYPFEIVLAMVISGCVFNAFYQIFHQADLDVLLIDWEKPNRDPLGPNILDDLIREEQGLSAREAEAPVYKEYVSAWRYLFIVNELNELQSLRYICIEFTLFIFVFFLDGLGWDELSLAQPNSDVGFTTSNTSPRNPVLRYFLTCSLLLIIGYTQYVVKKVLSLWIATPIQNFIDLCAVANISVMVLDEYLHGYYIHGVSPNGYAELGLDELLESLHKEAAGRSRTRGIMPEDKSGLQSFEIFIPTAIRKTYNFLAKHPVQSGLSLYREGLKEASGLPSIPEALPDAMSIQNMQEIRLELNRRLKIYIAGLVKDAKTQILEKSAWQRFLRMPPVDLSLLDGTPYFYKDPSIGFESSFLMGREFSFLLMDIMIFELFDYTIENTYIAILLTYLFSKIVSEIRQKAGEWNLSRKTLVNKRFLL
ncbi:hypothetical protein SteCoe_7436 [Stentor coeruleus]|uniref:Meckelin n=1 Tax=Stentor coeruleus TaxID=5963 RepID=A0A1R2CMN5_9CILI|nr:hypothetical protein SteCoe_7436 [Stentor coeruleus]